MAMQAILGCSMATPPLALRSLPCSSRHHTFLSSKHSEFSAPASSKLACPSTSSAAASATLVTGPFLVRPFASRVCDLTGKRANNGYKVSFSNHRTKKLQGVNLQYKRLWWEEGKRFVRLRLSTKALKTVEKNGLDAMAKKAGIDLTKH